MSIADIVRERNVSEIMHFTTNKGILGILDSKTLKSRTRLTTDERLEYIFQPNAANRDKDRLWHDYVNLSISRINTTYFSVSGNWHKDKDLWWCVLAYSPDILSHDKVHFATTNNIYTGCHRDTGAAGLRRLFSPQITRWVNNVVVRPSNLPDQFTTCIQAEVLYPEKLSTDFLRTIYVMDEKSADELAGQMSMLGHSYIPIEIRPDIFTQD